MLLILSATLTAQKKDKSKDKEDTTNLSGTIWQDLGDLSSLNLFYGAGGQSHAPDANGKFTFVKENDAGTSPKFEVTDDQGVRWKVKLGQEPQSETAATRLLWAAGYFVDEDYYLPELKVMNMPKLKRGGQFVSANGTIHKARLERKLKEIKNLGTWSWFDNPLQGKRELNGLRVLMSLINNWDLKSVNNSIYAIGDERRYVISDLGASFGNTGNSFSRSKSSPKDYANSRFIERSDPEFVDFSMHSRPFIFSAFDISNYETRTRMEEITKHIPRGDAKWLGQRLSQLSENQVSDCFRAAGYTPAEIAIYTQAVLKRIAELNAL
jgi:hypothetical protein